MNLSEAVKQYRTEHKYSLREFADLCGLSHVQIYRIEKGVKTDGTPFEPKIKTLKKLRRVWVSALTIFSAIVRTW